MVPMRFWRANSGGGSANNKPNRTAVSVPWYFFINMNQHRNVISDEVRANNLVEKMDLPNNLK